MNNYQLNSLKKRHSQKGLSAIELLISMAMFLIVMGSVYGILRLGNMSRSTINSRTENVKNVRLALNTIGREAVNAGLGYNRIGGTVPDDFTTENFGLPADADTQYDLLTAISSGFNISESDLSNAGEKNDVVAFAFRDFQFNNGFPIVIKDVVDNGNSLTLKTPDGACANCRPFDLFLIEAGDGRQAVVLSTDIVDGNSIVLGGNTDALDINYGNKNKGKTPKDAQKNVDEAQKKLTDALQKLVDEQLKLVKETLKGDPKQILQAQQKVAEAQQAITDAQNVLAAALAILNGSGGGSATAGSPVKKCQSGITTGCLNYDSVSVVAKKIYLVSYNVGVDGTLYRTTFGDNTGAGADQQIVKQPIATGVKSLKIHYLLSDGTTTDDPSVANTQKDKCNEIIQIEVSITVESKTDNAGRIDIEPITLTSTFSTRNIKYDTY